MAQSVWHRWHSTLACILRQGCECLQYMKLVMPQPGVRPLTHPPTSRPHPARRQNPRPPVALMSFPGSGNTWVRHVLETLTGYHTGSIYHAEQLFDVFQAEADGNRTHRLVIAVKTHKLHRCSQWRRGIVIVRHPVHAILSEYQRQRSGNKTAGVDPKDWDWDDWRKTSAGLCDHWKWMHSYALGRAGTVKPGPGGADGGCVARGGFKVFFYEDLTTASGGINPHFLDALLEWLGIAKADAYVDCAIANSRGSYKRVVPPDHPARLALTDQKTLEGMQSKGCLSAYEEYTRRFERLRPGT